MPKATAVWLVDNTSLTFDQIAKFCGLHILEIQGIADGDVATGIKGINPVTNGQITLEEITRCEAKHDTNINLSSAAIKLIEAQKLSGKKGKYIPIARRQDRPNATMWLLKNYPDLTDTNISKLIGTTKSTINLIRNKTHWNYSNLRRKDPVLLGLCTQEDLNYANMIDKQKAESKDNT